MVKHVVNLSDCLTNIYVLFSHQGALSKKASKITVWLPRGRFTARWLSEAADRDVYTTVVFPALAQGDKNPFCSLKKEAKLVECIKRNKSFTNLL